MIQHLSKTYSAELEGIKARCIEVEVDLNVGLHAFNIVGLADKALSEARERVNSALKNSGAKPPARENRRITVNLAPADVKKTGTHYDLAIALGYLLATKQIKEFDASRKIFVGELALDGRLRSVGGALNIAEMAAAHHFEELYLPVANANEAAAVRGLRVLPIESLAHILEILEGKRSISQATYVHAAHEDRPVPDFSEIKGQEHAKRAMMVAAAGGHNMLMSGPPGVGKSLLAQAMTGVLPSLAEEESIEITKIWSAAGLPLNGLLGARPFRSPHQTASLISIVGGGSNPRPGEISLAHRGILFLDELPEFSKNILEALRQPLETGAIHIARAKQSLTFPAKFSLVAAMNPCPCGYFGDSEKECLCSAFEVMRYQKRISGPLLDRIDLQVKVQRVALEDLRSARRGASESGALRKKIEEARSIQRARFQAAGLPYHTNGEMSSRQTEDFAALDEGGEAFLGRLSLGKISPRGYFRMLKTARTIADLGGSKKTRAEDLAEAFSYRLREES